MPTYTSNMNLYKWDEKDAKRTTIAEMASNADKIDTKLQEHISQLADVAHNITSYGATGDGITDDTLAIKNTIAATPSGGDVLIPRGLTFVISDTLVINKPITVKGGGKLFKKSGTNKISIDIQSDHTKVEGISIDGNNAGQTLQNFNNDEIRLTGVKYCKIRHCKIENSAGGGIAGYNSGFNSVRDNVIKNSGNNGIFFANLGSDSNHIEGNIVDGTRSQNGIFITASAASTDTADSIKNNKILNNTVMNCADTCIESGIRSLGSIVKGNHALKSPNPPILFRDNQNPICTNNIVNNEGVIEGGTGDGIAFVKQLTSANGITDTRGICSNNQVSNVKRYGIFLGSGDDIDVSNNKIYNVGTGKGIYLAYNKHSVKNNRIKGAHTGISFDEAGTSSCDDSTIEGNSIQDVTRGIVAYGKTLNNVKIINNRITNASEIGIKADTSTAVNSFMFGNIFKDTPTKYLNRTIFIKNANGSSDVTVPLTQYAAMALCEANETGLVMIKFGSDFALLWVYEEAGSGDGIGYQFIKGSANVIGTNTGSTGWGISKSSSGRIVMYRRGATLTTNIPYTITFLQV